MGKTAAYTNTKNYTNNNSFDGKAVEAGKVLVPFLKNEFHLKSGEYIDENFTTMHLGDFRFPIGFMAIREDKYVDYIQNFWDEVNKNIELRREGKCVIGKNPKRIEILSLNYEFENEGFDIEDDRYPSVENQVLDKMCPDLDYDEVRDRALSRLEEQNTRHAQIIRLELEGKNIEEICIAIKLKSSRGREVINEANDALCDILKMPHMKTKHRK